MTKKLVVIGGGEIRNKTTLPVDRLIRSLYQGELRPYALFIPTASHDSKPYFNSFRKTYTSELDCKSDVAILTRNEMTVEHCAEKVAKADIIYVGGGDTAYMLDVWKKTGFDKILLDAYDQGKIICGLSAGAICWFKYAHSDYDIMENGSNEYKILDGLGLIDGLCVPHFNEPTRFADGNAIAGKYIEGYGICNDSCIYFEDGKPTKTVGEVYKIKNGIFTEFEL